MATYFDKLRVTATTKQIEYINAIEQTGSQIAAAELLGVTRQNVSMGMTNARKRMAAHAAGILPEGADLQNRSLLHKDTLARNANYKPKILVIPDTQVKPGVPLKHLKWIGRYIAKKRPDIIVMLGDFADMASLSSYDKGKRSYEGRNYKNDIESAQTGMKMLVNEFKNIPIKNKHARKPVPYNPKMYLLLGNHEDRINRAINLEPMLYGTISTDDLKYADYGWQVIPFLEVLVLHNIAFSHYFVTGAMGRPASSPQAILNKKHMSCIAGHQQGRQSISGVSADGRQLTAIIAGSCYLHDEDYLGIQGNKHWRGLVMLHNVCNGEFDEVYVPISYLQEKYEKDGDDEVYCPPDKR